MIRQLALACAMLIGAASEGAAQAIDSRGQPYLDALRRSGEGLIARSGAPERLRYEPSLVGVGIRDTKSGLLCLLPDDVFNRTVKVQNDEFECSYFAESINFGEKWHAFPLASFKGAATTPEGYINAFMARWQQQEPDAKILPPQTSKAEIDITTLWGSPGPYLMRRMEIGGARRIFGVKDLNGWRYVYFAAGMTEVIESHAPQAFLGKIYDIKPNRM